MCGIGIVGGNGSGKTTLGKALAEVLGYSVLDIEQYYFEDSIIPYAKARTRAEVQRLLQEDIQKYQSFILSAVHCDFGDAINEMYDFIIYIEVPLPIRMNRVKARAREKFGDRVKEGGDMYEQEEAFFQFVKHRS